MTDMSIRSRVFYCIRQYDIELAETFSVRCPDIRDMMDLNTFFHQTISQYPQDTRGLREVLDDTMVLDDWLRHFREYILPFMRKHRFPPATGRNPATPYACLASLQQAIA